MKLNSDQRKAASVKKGNHLVLAPAGSGKTATLCSRVAWLAKNSDQEILLLTFTVKAAEEMLERVKKSVSIEALSQITSGTFHSFAYSVMKRCHKYLGYSSPLNVIDTRDQKELMSSVARQLNCKVSVKSIMHANSFALNTMVSLSEALNESMKNISAANIELCEQVVAEYERTKKKYNMLDFDDLLVNLHKLLQIPKAKKKIAVFGHILLDEVQDNNNLQIKIIESLLTPKTKLFAVGDEAQSIYQFRGANRSFILAFPEQFSASCTMLTENYRSTQQILDLANCVASAFIDGFKVKMKSKLCGEKPRYIHFYDESEQVKLIVKEVSRLKENLGDTAVIYRASSSADKLEAALRAEKIPYSRRGTGSLFELAVIKDLLLFLRAATSKSDAIAWRGILLCVPNVGPSLAGKIYAEVQEGGIKALQGFFGTKADVGLRRLYKYLSKAAFYRKSARKALVQAIEYWSEYLPKRTTKSKDDVAEYYSRIRDIAVKYPSVRKFLIDMALDTSKDIDPDKGKLILSTIHSVKGMGFSRVYILNAVEGKLPSTYFLPEEDDPSFFEKLEEERRLFYVALTRARKYLTICAPMNDSERASWDKCGTLEEADSTSRTRFLDVEGIEKTYTEKWPGRTRQKNMNSLSMLHKLRMQEME